MIFLDLSQTTMMTRVLMGLKSHLGGEVFCKKQQFYETFFICLHFLRYHLNGAWFDDDSVVISCEGDGPTTPASTTSRPDTTTTENNGPTTTASPKGTKF